jgi:hypothetical protein
MKKNLLFVILIFSIIFLSFNFSKTEKLILNNVMFQFAATNGNGNNVYFDNFSTGVQFNNDLSVTSFNLQDKNYLLPGQSSIMVLPSVLIMNTGKNDAIGATVTMMETGSSYNVTKNIPGLSMGQSAQVYFDSLSFTSDVIKNIKIYINWASDEWHNNDSLFQETVFHQGVTRKVLFEAHTSSTCGPCASQNPSLDAFIQTKWDSIVPIKYHVWWPAPGNDPMFYANQNQVRVRVSYNGVNAVPALMVDGVFLQISGYTTLTNLTTPFYNRLSKGAPLSLTVNDTRLTGDTINASVTLQIVSPLSVNGDFRLKVAANERKITYSTPPGTNGETIFNDVFRRMYPSADGIQIPLTPGTYNYEIKYKRESAWVDSMIYSAVFVQNEVTKEVMNCNKARNYYLDNIKSANKTSPENSSNILLQNQFCRIDENNLIEPKAGFYVENFEYMFPANGWKLINPDDAIPFMQYGSANGPSYTGGKSVRYSCFVYLDTGQMDYLKTKIYNNIDLNDSVKFDYAYAVNPGHTDRLRLLMSTDGGSTFPYTVFDKSGNDLATAPSTSASFIPSGASQWATFKGRIGDVIVGIQPIGTIVPTNYDLKQNYPNPFNPVTKIEYQISKPGNVKISVYDISGKEIKILINEIHTPGVYQVNFDGTNLSSGVYFYELTAGDFTAVKRMVLIK